MTMRLRIKNEDLAQTAVLTLSDFDPINPSTPTKDELVEIEPNGEAVVWLHNARRISIAEKKK